MDISTALTGASWRHTDDGSTSTPSRDELRRLLAFIALRSDTWASRVRHDRDERWYELLLRTAAVDVWLVGWWPGQWTPLHDHGGASGALTVLRGTLTEESVVSPSAPHSDWRSLTTGTTIDIAAHLVHRVGNAGRTPATSIHAYSPPDVDMRTYGHVMAGGRAAHWPAVAGGRL